jgi:type I restriction enzyme S subunit
LTAIAEVPLTTNQGCRSLTPDPSKVDTEFLYYLMTASTDYLHQHANGTTFQELSGGVMKQLEFLFPPLAEQVRIAEVLAALDDRISSLRSLSVTAGDAVVAACEAAIDDRAGSGTIPLPQATRLVNGGAYTKGATGTGRMVIRIKELNSGTSESTVYNSITVPADKTAFPGDVLFAWSGSLGVWRWFADEAIINQHIFKVLPAEHPVWLGWVHILRELETFRDIAAGKATTMGHITKDHLDRTRVPVLSKSELKALTLTVEPLWDYQLAIGRQLVALETLRNFLLPRLVTGELRVREAEEEVEASS